jgi:hypothetical protein
MTFEGIVYAAQPGCCGTTWIALAASADGSSSVVANGAITTL